MLLEIANSQPGVLRRPGASAVFMGFGESSLEFLLMFWAEQNTHFGLRSEVSIRISSALREAGIDIPFPQREIRVHSAGTQPVFKQSA
jgi:small-conductance mechanosensitive channel